MIKDFRKKFTCKAMAAIMMMSMATAAFGTPAYAAETEEDYYLYLMIDPAETADDFVVEPTVIEIPADTDTSTTLGALVSDYLADENIDDAYTTTYGYYITGIECADAANYAISASTYSMYSSLPDVAFHEDIVAPFNTSTNLLSEYNFTGFSGWMMTVDNETTETYDGNTYYYSLGTTLEDLLNWGVLSDSESPVLEMFYSMNMGADVGVGDAYLPESVTFSSYLDKYTYDWSGSYAYVAKADKADRTELVKALADNEEDADYDNSLAVLKNITSSELSVNTATYRVNN